MKRRALGRAVVALAAGGGLTAGSLALSAAPAVAATNYGPGAIYQVEISANTSPTTFASGNGNFWAWAALYPSATSTTHGTIDYQESDCIHLDALGIHVQAAAHDTGDGTWYITGGMLHLTTVKIIGGLETATITVPMPTRGSYGHTNGMNLKITKGTTPTGKTPLTVGTTFAYPSQNQIAH